MSGIQYPTPAYHPETDLINQAAELAGFKDPSEYLPLKIVNFLGLLLDVVRSDTELMRFARAIALFYRLPIEHLVIGGVSLRTVEVEVEKSEPMVQPEPPPCV